MLKNWEDVLDFGKHEDSTVEDVFVEEPSYLEWLIDNTERTDFDETMDRQIRNAALEMDEFDDNNFANYWMSQY